MRIFFYVITLIFIMSSCSEELEQLIVAEYPSGSPMRVEHVKFLGDKKIVLKEARYYPNGEVETLDELANGILHGKKEYFKKDGFKWMEEFYDAGQLDGEFTVWYRSGDVNYSGAYSKGKPDGEWIFYNVEGNKVKSIIYELGTKIDENLY